MRDDIGGGGTVMEGIAEGGILLRRDNRRDG
jgi:hypothetical protein